VKNNKVKPKDMKYAGDVIEENRKVFIQVLF
jgi:hypothetical protein